MLAIIVDKASVTLSSSYNLKLTLRPHYKLTASPRGGARRGRRRGVKRRETQRLVCGTCDICPCDHLSPSDTACHGTGHEPDTSGVLGPRRSSPEAPRLRGSEAAPYRVSPGQGLQALTRDPGAPRLALATGVSPSALRSSGVEHVERSRDAD
eukprot:750173-Hanusia_phi.AAC.6